MLKTSFTSREAAELAGFRTAMMVDYLCRTGIVAPSARTRPGRGRYRLYTFGDVVLLRALNRLLSSGLPVARLKRAIARLQRDFRHLSPEPAIKRYVITDGRELFLADQPGALVNLNRDGQLAFAFIVDIKHARAEVLTKVIANPTRYLAAAREE